MMRRRRLPVAWRAVSPVALLTAALTLAACSGAADPNPDPNPGGQELSSDTAAATEAEEPADGTSEAAETIRIELPTVPAVTLPDVSVLSQTGDLVAAQLGDLVTGPLGGVELVSASCADEGDLVYSGSQSGQDLFDIERDGSGQYREESDDGLVSLVVDADGVGQFVDSTDGEVTTITVDADGTGEYYSERGRDLVTVKVTGPGTGEYYDNRDGQLLTVTLLSDGSGEYYREGENGLITVRARADGSGEYYNEQTVDETTTTVRVDPDGSWALNVITASRRSEILVNADGSGSYTVSGLRSLRFDFDQDGWSLNPDVDVQLSLPEPPRFSVADAFPPLGRLGSLTPPCATVIRFDSALLFDFGSADLRPDTVELLGQVVNAVNAVGKPVEIVGHTDSIGSDEANLDLSLDRAAAVEEALRGAGMDVEAEISGVGERQPVAPNENADGSDNPTGREQNRRVEIVIREIG